MTDRQKHALELKGDHKIYYEDDTADNKKLFDAGELDESIFKDTELVRTIADLSEVRVVSMTEKPEDLDGRAYIPDWTPDWLYKILELWDACEFMESMFEFASKEDADEFKAICDVINE